MNCRGEADIRGSVFQHGCLAPDVNQQYIIVRVRFPGTLKLYRYWAPMHWQLTPGAVVRVWVSKREKYKNVTVCEVSSTARITSVRALKAIDSVVSSGKPTNAEAKDEVVQAGAAAASRATHCKDGKYPPRTVDKWTVAHVEFEPGGKQYTYWVRVNWAVKRGDFLRAWRTSTRKFAYARVVDSALGPYEELILERKVAVSKTPADIVERTKPGWAKPWLDKQVAASTAAVTRDEVINFKTLDYTDLELRVVAMQQDRYKQFANHFMLNTNKQADERVVGIPPELGMGYSVTPGTGKSSGITGKCITHMIIDDPLMEELQAAPRTHRYNDRITIPHYPTRSGSCSGGPLPSNIPKTKSQEDTVELKIQTITFVNGLDISKMTPDQLFSHINAAENEIRKFNTLVHKPKAVADRIVELEKGIESLVRAVDGDESATYKPVVEPTFRERLADSLTKAE